MSKEDFNNKINKIYEAIRKAYGYSDEADEIVDLVYEMADVLEDKIVEE